MIDAFSFFPTAIVLMEQRNPVSSEGNADQKVRLLFLPDAKRTAAGPPYDRLYHFEQFYGIIKQ